MGFFVGYKSNVLKILFFFFCAMLHFKCIEMQQIAVCYATIPALEFILFVQTLKYLKLSILVYSKLWHTLYLIYLKPNTKKIKIPYVHFFYFALLAIATKILDAVTTWLNWFIVVVIWWITLIYLFTYFLLDFEQNPCSTIHAHGHWYKSNKKHQMVNRLSFSKLRGG